MKVKVVSIPVMDQAKALAFYTDKMGFVKKHDMPLGGGNRWLTVVNKEEQEGVEVLLEPAPLHFEPAKVYQDALKAAGIPCTGFYVDSVDDEYERLMNLDVSFSVKRTVMGTSKIAVLDDTCGNFIQLVEIL